MILIMDDIRFIDEKTIKGGDHWVPKPGMFLFVWDNEGKIRLCRVEKIKHPRGCYSWTATVSASPA
jgi:hypothetical protein